MSTTKLKKITYISMINLAIFLHTSIYGSLPIFQYSTPSKKEIKPTQIIEEKPSTISIYKCKNIDANELKEKLDIYFPNLKTHSSNKTQKLTLQGTPKTILQALNFLDQYDQTLKPLLFEIEIIEIAHAELEQYSNALSKLSTGFLINFDFEKNKILLPNSLDAIVSGLIQKGQAKIIAKPILKTTENNKAYVRVGDQLPFITSISEGQVKISNFQQINTGIYVEIEPKIVTTSNVLASLQIEISNVKLWKEINSIQYPIIATRKTETTISLSENTPLIIAGLFQEDSNENQNKIPIFSSIPFIGNLFKGHKKESNQTDVVIKVKLLP